MPQERFGLQNVQPPTLFDLAPAPPRPPERKHNINQIRYLVQVASSFDTVGEILSAPKSGGRIFVMDADGQYWSAQPNSNGSFLVHPLNIHNFEEFQDQDPVDGLIFVAERRYMLPEGTLPYIAAITDRLGPLANREAFFVAFLRAPKSERVPGWITEAARRRYRKIIPNDGSGFDQGLIIVKDSLPRYAIIASTRCLPDEKKEDDDNFPWNVAPRVVPENRKPTDYTSRQQQLAEKLGLGEKPGINYSIREVNRGLYHVDACYTNGEIAWTQEVSIQK